jgi:hypothetical protein
MFRVGSIKQHDRRSEAPYLIDKPRKSRLREGELESNRIGQES